MIGQFAREGRGPLGHRNPTAKSGADDAVQGGTTHRADRSVAADMDVPPAIPRLPGGPYDRPPNARCVEAAPKGEEDAPIGTVAVDRVRGTETYSTLLAAKPPVIESRSKTPPTSS